MQKLGLEEAVVRTRREVRTMSLEAEAKGSLFCNVGKLVNTLTCANVEVQNVLNGLNNMTKENSRQRVRRATWNFLYASEQMSVEKDKLKNELFSF